MKGYALVIGNNAYHNSPLDNAVNDAECMGKKLTSLGFVTDVLKDGNLVSIHQAISNIETRGRDADVILFFFSGHGVQIEGVNYLTAIDGNFQDAASVKYYGGTCLDEVLERMNTTKASTKILILDACRDNPFFHKLRGYAKGLAPIYAPKGTLIAFSTSPGETAQDYGGDNHSVYTGTLLDVMEEQNITVEECFKRVRSAVYSKTNGKQLSWEHTSLIGNFYFNEGNVTQTDDIPYRKDVVKDGIWESRGTKAENEITNLRITDWYKQKDALQALDCMSLRDMDKDTQFLFGRSLLSSACGGEWMAKKIMNKLSSWLLDWDMQGENHVLNGLLFEMYFNNKGILRTDGFKSVFIDELCSLEQDANFTKSFEFIESILKPMHQNLFYIPSAHPKTLQIDIITEPVEEKKNTVKVTSLLISGNQYLAEYSDDKWDMRREKYSYTKFKEELSHVLATPVNRLNINFNLPLEDIKMKKIMVPCARIIKQ